EQQGPRVTSSFAPGGLAELPADEGTALAQPGKADIQAKAQSSQPSAQSVVVNLGGRDAKPPTVDELSGQIAQRMGFKPEEAEAYRKELGRNPFYSDVADPKAAMESVFNRRDPNTGDVAIPFTHEASRQSAMDWLKTYRAGKAAEQ